MSSNKEYLAPAMRERAIDMERYFLASDFTSSQNEDLVETDYDW